jgi:hypothetical protein
MAARSSFGSICLMAAHSSSVSSQRMNPLSNQSYRARSEFVVYDRKRRFTTKPCGMAGAVPS